MQGWSHILMCIAVPCAIGSSLYVLFNLWDRRRRRVRAEDALPVINYLI